ncbi:invasion associated locus B family protein [Albimonas sp. CAU 1670]|uniref:invasion associated locus B family protein n=1 Tax=Albimonas sp. CAU 1670 TaxID=3032599 RepID=UPI0031F34663
MKAEAKRAGMKRIGARLAAVALALAAVQTAPVQAAAQQSTNRVEAFRDWSVFTADAGGPVCWIVTQPQSSVAKRGGKPVQVQRGDIYLTVAVRPRQGVKNEIAMVAGYPFKEGSTVEAEIGSKKFELFTEGENAWTYPNDDGDIITAMKAGAAVVLTGVSARGTTTIDRFSLLGFTDALTSAQTRCK